MIINNRHMNSIVGRLEQSKFHFYLTGSRFFGGFTPVSDWDYFVQDSVDVKIFLEDNGFSISDDVMVKYDDITVVELYYINDIHVQLVTDAIFKAKVQEFLSRNCDMKNIPKIARKYIWNLGIKVTQALSQVRSQ